MSQSKPQFRPSTNGSSPWRPPAGPPNVLDEPLAVARATTSTARGVNYDTYVLKYASRQRANILLTVIGLIIGIGAAYYLDGGALLVLSIAIALGLILSGGVSFLVTAGAHDSYTNRLAVSRTENYFDPRPQPTADVRPVIHAGDATIRRGRFSLPQSTWQKLFESARNNDGRLARDKVVAARGLPRELYHGDAWQTTLDELRRLGLIDADNCITNDGWNFYESLHSPTPPDGAPVRSFIERTGTNERPRTAAGEVGL